MLLLGLPAAASGEPPPRDEIDRWVPSFGAWGAMLVSDADGSILSNVRGASEPTPGSFETTGDDLFVDPVVGGTIELMTPGIRAIPGSPRFFVRGDVGADLGFTRSVAKEGSPGEFVFPPNQPNPPPSTITGQGSQLEAAVKPLVASAGAGIAFTLDVGERRLRFKPSVEYHWDEVEASGLVANVGGTAGNLEFVRLQGSDEKSYHAIGPGLEVEMDVAQWGEIGMSLFLNGRGFKFLGDRDIEFTDPSGADCPGGPEPCASWRYERAAWGFHGGVGFRFRWAPRD